jgi:putative ABC transport system ATP-binding protein
MQKVEEPMSDQLLEVKDLSKTYRRGDLDLDVLKSINLELDAGDYVSLMGPSGSGKTTLLNIIGGIDSPTSGTVTVAGTNIAELDDKGLAEWRTANVGFVFQQYNLLPVLSAVENVELPLLLYDMPKQERRRRALAALEVVGLAHRAHHYPRQMSGGEEQRTAVARAFVTDPRLIIADEPTGNLDATAAANVLDLLGVLNRELGKTILMVTHDSAAAARARRVVRLNKGELLQEGRPR